MYQRIPLPTAAQFFECTRHRALRMKKSEKPRSGAHTPATIKRPQDPRQVAGKRRYGWSTVQSGEHAAKFLRHSHFKRTYSAVCVRCVHAIQKTDNQNRMHGVEVSAIWHELSKIRQRTIAFRRPVALRLARQARHHVGSIGLDLL